MRLPPAIFKTKTYSVYWQGERPAPEIKINYDPGSTLVLTNEEKTEIEKQWRELEGKTKRVKDLPLYRLLSFRNRNGEPELNFGLTGYKEYQGTNVLKPGWALDNPDEKSANPLAISVVAVTTDNKVFLQLRAGDVGEYGGWWHVTPSGHIHPPQDLTEAVQAEIFEELGVSPGDVDDKILVTGLIVNTEMMKPELTFLTRIDLSSQEVLSHPAPDRWEYERLKLLDWEKENMEYFLIESLNNMVPPGHAAILLGGRAAFGDDWMARVKSGILDL